MANEIQQKLQKLQDEKNSLIFKISNWVSVSRKNEYKKRIIEIKQEMAILNELNGEEKNIHIIWIGVPPEGEFDYLKLWAKYNQEYKIHIWTDFTHILSHILGVIIYENAKVLDNGFQIHDYHLEAKLKDEFYYDYHLKNSNKTFDENVERFLDDKNYASIDEVLSWIKECKAKFIAEQKDIQQYTSNEIILHDISQEKDNVFPNKDYENGYLEILEHLQICAGASDRLRYAILDKFGGVYLDTDVMLKFDLNDIDNKQKMNDLVKLQELKNKENIIYYQNFQLILNHMIFLDHLNKLNDQSLSDFTKKWVKFFPNDFNKDFNFFKKFAINFKKIDLKIFPRMFLFEFPINNFFQLNFHADSEGYISNAFLVAKKNCKFLQEVMKKIEIADEKISKIDTYKKIINKEKINIKFFFS